MHHVYLISGTTDDFVYIGYCPADATSPLDHFLVGTRRSDDRADIRFMQEHGNDANTLTATILETVDNEWEAHTLRNEHRANHIYSFTGPTHWPSGSYDRAMKENPERVEAANDRWTARSKKTARDAYAAGLWTKDQVKEFATKHGRDQIIADLDALTPNEFLIKYEGCLR